ncbi:MAG: ATPase [Dehalococcoidia bacterium]|nr:ATPase [Dehalococcoidia bacterium]
MAGTASSQAATEREIVVSRVIEGPRRLVFQAYTELTHLERWWGPNGFTTTTHSFEFRPGGVWDFTMHGPDGTDYPNRIEWLEIVAPERLVMLHGESQDDPEAFTATVTFVEQGDATELTLRNVLKTKEQRDRVVEQYHAIEGAREGLEKLAAYIATLAVDES